MWCRYVVSYWAGTIGAGFGRWFHRRGVAGCIVRPIRRAIATCPRIPLVTEAAMTPAQRQVHDAMVNGPRKSAPGRAARHRHAPGRNWRRGDVRSGAGAAVQWVELRGRACGSSPSCSPDVTGIASSNGPRMRPRRARPAFRMPRSKRYATADRGSRPTTSRRSMNYGDRIADPALCASSATYRARAGDLRRRRRGRADRRFDRRYCLIALTLNAAEFGVPTGMTPPLPPRAL